MKYLNWYLGGLFSVVNLIAGVLFVFANLPKSLWYGYRSARSMKSKSAWRYSTKLLGYSLIILTVILLSCFIPLNISDIHFGITMGCIIGIELIGVICIFIIIECLLARKERMDKKIQMEKYEKPDLEILSGSQEEGGQIMPMAVIVAFFAILTGLILLIDSVAVSNSSMRKKTAITTLS